MTHTLDPFWPVLVASSFLYIVLGGWVLTLEPRRRRTTLLGGFAIVFGLIFAPFNLLVAFDLLDPPTLLDAAIQSPPALLAYALALGLAWEVPEPLRDRRLLGTAVAIGFSFSVVQTVSFARVGEVLGVPVSGLHLSLSAVLRLSFGALWAAVALLALRAAPHRQSDAGQVTQLALLAVALAMLRAFTNGMQLTQAAGASAAGDLTSALRDSTGGLAWLTIAGLWGWNMTRADEGTSRIHRAAMLGILVPLVAGAVYQASVPAVDPYTNVTRGAVRTLGVFLLAYGVLRHDLAGLDAKVEWGVSKTTMAGIFVATFFVAGELAETFFGDVFGPYVGVVAAGALVFFLAPLQRLADRFAAGAVPGGRPPAAEAYRNALRMALADGRIGPREEDELAHRAEELGLGPRRVLELRRQVEAQVRRERADDA